MHSLVVDDIHKQYAYAKVLNGVSFSVDGGTSTIVLGSNGSGKSTLLKIVAGLVAPDRGSVSLQGDGRTVSGSSIARRVSYTSAYVGLYRQMTLKENLELVLSLRQRSAGASALELSKFVQLERGYNQQVGSFSTGMIQRAKLACALASDGDALILDEPFANLDELGIACVHRAIEKYVAAKKPVVVATNIDAVAKTFDEHVILDR